jgi:hypothetical protein
MRSCGGLRVQPAMTLHERVAILYRFW